MDNATAQMTYVDHYASALLSIAGAEDDPQAAADEIFRAAQGLSGHAELVETLGDPRIPGERKQGIVDDLLGGRASKVTVAAMGFIVGAGQAKNLGDIASRVAELAAEAEGEIVAEVRASIELDAAQIERLTAALSEVTGRRVQVKAVVDPSVLGGLVAKVGDTVLDGSVQHRFSELREQWG
ncbi:MAG: ATP synthase F1 subunit delta [Actinomycetota bacterium]